MDCSARQAVVAELNDAFGEALDVTPTADQPLHVLLPKLQILTPWKPSPARGLISFEGWPSVRPQFWIDVALTNAEGHPPRSNSEQLVLGEPWRYFSFSFDWPVQPLTPTRAIQAWLNRFREST
jgi:hypothetical protein